MVAAISYRGETLWSKGYGVIDKKSTTVPDSNTIFRVGSISKVFAVSAKTNYSIHSVMCVV